MKSARASDGGWRAESWWHLLGCCGLQKAEAQALAPPLRPSAHYGKVASSSMAGYFNLSSCIAKSTDSSCCSSCNKQYDGQHLATGLP